MCRSLQHLLDLLDAVAWGSPHDNKNTGRDGMGREGKPAGGGVTQWCSMVRVCFVCGSVSLEPWSQEEWQNVD